jgi:flotillin
LAKAEAERIRIDGIAKAEAQKAQGLSEAEIIRMKGLAEAEAKEKIAEAFEQFGQAAILDMIVKMLPEYAKQVASPLANIDKITVVDTGGSGENGGANKITSYATNLMASLQESLKASSGIDVKELIENYSGKANVKRSIEELTEEVKKSAQ